jgi:hypothetical protein
MTVPHRGRGRLPAHRAWAFPLIERVVLDVRVASETWDLSTLPAGCEFVLLDFPGVGGGLTHVRDLYLTQRGLRDVHTVLVMVDSEKPGGQAADAADQRADARGDDRPGGCARQHPPAALEVAGGPQLFSRSTARMSDGSAEPVAGSYQALNATVPKPRVSPDSPSVTASPSALAGRSLVATPVVTRAADGSSPAPSSAFSSVLLPDENWPNTPTDSGLSALLSARSAHRPWICSRSPGGRTELATPSAHWMCSSTASRADGGLARLFT